ncbi:choice-of-anchor P family protein [Nocardioides pyridinolyticus]
MLRRPLSTLAVLAVAALGTTLVPAPAGAAPVREPAPRAGSDIALKAGAYGTRAEGSDVPADSGMTAFTAIGCSVQPGIDRGNVVAEVALPDAGTASGVKTRVWTRRDGAARHSYSRSSTAEVVLAESPLGTLSIRGVTSLSHAWYDGRRFHAETKTSIGRIVLTPPVGPAQEIDIPSPGQPVEIPGLARLAVGDVRERQNATSAQAWAVALRVKLLPSGTEVFVARSGAQALSGVKWGRFGGYSAGTEASILGGVLISGRNPLSLMPCQGTQGRILGKDDVDLDLGGGLHVEGVSSKEWAKRFSDRSEAWERGSIAGLSLGDGQLEIEAVVGKASVTRMAGGKLDRSTQGTRIGAMTVNGEPRELPLDQVMEIPGVAKLEPHLVERLPSGLKVVALRITLLDGSGAVLDLGIAQTTIRR